MTRFLVAVTAIAISAALGYYLSLPALIALTVLVIVMFGGGTMAGDGLVQLVGIMIMLSAGFGIAVMWGVAIAVRWQEVVQLASSALHFLIR